MFGSFVSLLSMKLGCFCFWSGVSVFSLSCVQFNFLSLLISVVKCLFLFCSEAVFLLFVVVLGCCKLLSSFLRLPWSAVFDF